MGDLAATNPEFQSNLVPPFSHLMKSTNLEYFRLTQLSAASGAREQTAIISVLNILCSGTPLQIFDSVIGLYAVSVIYLRQVVGVLYKCRRHKAMHAQTFSLHVFPHANGRITISVRNLCEPLSVMARSFSTAVNPLSRITPNLSIFSRRILSIKTRYIFHLFSRLTPTRFASRLGLGAAKLLIA